MINNELLKFVQEQLAHNVPREQIIAILKPGGWSEADVVEALQALQSSSVPLLKTLLVSPAGKKRTLIISVIAFFLVIAGVAVWFYSSKVKTPALSTESQTISVPATPSVASSTPVLPFDSDLTVVWMKVPDEQNSASAIIAARQTISKDDSAFLSKYFGKGYIVKDLPVLASANTVTSRNMGALKAFDLSSTTPYFQCSAIMTPEQCNYQSVSNIGRLLLLRSYVLEKAGKIPEALSVTTSIIDFGQKVTREVDDVIPLLVGWTLQKDGYQRIVLLNPKLSKPFSISADEKASRINILREEHKKVFKFIYTRETEGLEYMADKNKVPSFPQTAEDVATVDEYRKSIALGKFNLEETKKYFYDSYKIAIGNVDVACGGPMVKAPYDISAEVNTATTTSNQSAVENYVGKILYWVTYPGFDGLNAKRCEVEALINKL